MYAALSAMIMDTEYHPQVHLHIIIDQNPGIDSTTAWPHTTVLHIGTEEVDLDHNHTTEGTTAKVAITPSEHILGHTTETTGDLTEVVHINSITTLLHMALTTTSHFEDPPLIEAQLSIHEITANHALSQPIGQLRKPHIRIDPIPEDHTEIHTIRRIQESPQMDIYSSDDISSDSNEDSDYLY